MSATFLNYTKEPVHVFTGAVNGERASLAVHRCTDFGSHFVILERGDVVALAACRGIGAPVTISVDREFDIPYSPIIYAVRQYWDVNHG